MSGGELIVPGMSPSLVYILHFSTFIDMSVRDGESYYFLSERQGRDNSI